MPLTSKKPPRDSIPEEVFRINPSYRQAGCRGCSGLEDRDLQVATDGDGDAAKHANEGGKRAYFVALEGFGDTLENLDAASSCGYGSTALE